MCGCGCWRSAIPRQCSFDHADQIELPFRSGLLEHLPEVLACAALGDVKVVGGLFDTLAVEQKCCKASLRGREREEGLKLEVIAIGRTVGSQRLRLDRRRALLQHPADFKRATQVWNKRVH